ncbi:MAG: DUF1684 domain-containing protein [Candidatus Krumholzibacteriia bacterium]
MKFFGVWIKIMARFRSFWPATTPDTFSLAQPERRLRVAAAVLLAAVLPAAAGGCGDGGPVTSADYAAEVDAWHAGRIDRLTAPDGWLTLVGLHELSPGEHTVGSRSDAAVVLPADAPADLGTLEVNEQEVLLRAAPGAEVTANGMPLAGGAVTALASDAGAEPTVVRTGSVSFHVIDRGGRRFLRVRDSESSVRRGFEGVERFPVDIRWRVEAQLVPDAEPRSVEMPNVLGQVDREPTPGTLVFELEGRRCELTPVGETGQPLFIVFADATSGQTTYAGGRFLSAPAPDAEGRVVLDFNRATNPPCVFTPYATCPLPPPENRLPVAVTAGEKMWGDHH